MQIGFTFLVFRSSPERINPVKISIHPYVYKHNAATNQIVILVKVDETFTTI